MSDVAN